MTSDSVSRVTRDFLTTTPGELCVSRDDIVLVKTKVDRLWSKCRLLPNGPEGLVPSGNLIEMDPPPVAPGQVLFVAVSDFSAQQEGDLIMQKGLGGIIEGCLNCLLYNFNFLGEFVVGTHNIDENWWHGKCGFNSGMFPVSYVLRMDAEEVHFI